MLNDMPKRSWHPVCPQWRRCCFKRTWTRSFLPMWTDPPFQATCGEVSFFYDNGCCTRRSRNCWRGLVSPLRRGFETAPGPLILQSFCSPALVASLKAERGLHAFAHSPEREHPLLLGIAERPDCALTLAYTPGSEIVGQVTLAPAHTWWQGVATTYEIAIEVSAHWRRLGIARQLLSFLHMHFVLK
jgi:hypothetical protein